MCDKHMVVAVPLLLRVKNQRFILEGYQLNTGLCHSLSTAFGIFKDIATKFFFKNNNFTDMDFSILLEGIAKLTVVSTLTYENNAFGLNSLRSIQ